MRVHRWCIVFLCSNANRSFLPSQVPPKVIHRCSTLSANRSIKICSRDSWFILILIKYIQFKVTLCSIFFRQSVVREFCASKQLNYHSIIDAVYLIIIYIKRVIKDIIHLGIGISFIFWSIKRTNVVFLSILKSKTTIINSYGIYWEISTTTS